jgi:hypothetical protein
MRGNAALTLLKLCLWITCVFHILVGISLNLDLGWKEWVGSAIYYADVDWSQPQFVYILRPLGAFMLTLGLLAGIAALDPLRHKSIVYAFILLWTLRTLQRLVFWGQIQDAFGIANDRMISGSLVVFGSGVLLLVFLLLAQRSSPVRLAGRAA